MSFRQGGAMNGGRKAARVWIAATTFIGTGHVTAADTPTDSGRDMSLLRTAIQDCRQREDDDARLRCYDRLHLLLEPPTYQGSLSQTTPTFVVETPTIIRYQSDGAIFVMYLQDAEGAIVQNLHLGGGGESRHEINAPGTYRLQVNGSETWRIWIEAQTPASP